MNLKKYFPYVVIFMLGIVVVFLIYNSSSKSSQLARADRYVKDLQAISGVDEIGSVHYHADIAIFVNGEKIDLSQQKYQLKSQHVHVEDGIGDTVHVHAKGIRLGHFLTSIGFKLTGNCIETDSGNFCNDGKSSVKFYVNGKQNYEMAEHEINDLDRLLISYGNQSEEDIEKQIEMVTKAAYELSGKEMELLEDEH